MAANGAPRAPFRPSSVPGLQREGGLWRRVPGRDIPRGDDAHPHPSCCPAAPGQERWSLGWKQKARELILPLRQPGHGVPVPCLPCLFGPVSLLTFSSPKEIGPVTAALQS